MTLEEFAKLWLHPHQHPAGESAPCPGCDRMNDLRALIRDERADERRAAFENLTAQEKALIDEFIIRQAWNGFQTQVGMWATSVFTKATPGSCLAHLVREVGELAASGEPEELADCALLLMHYAHKRGLSIYDECRKKFEVNKKREWGEPDAEGVQSHIEEPDGGAPVATCKCMRSDSSCNRGHHWHTCEVHQRLVMGQSDHGVHDGCTCPGTRGNLGQRGN